MGCSYSADTKPVKVKVSTSTDAGNKNKETQNKEQLDKTSSCFNTFLEEFKKLQPQEETEFFTKFKPEIDKIQNSLISLASNKNEDIEGTSETVVIVENPDKPTKEEPVEDSKTNTKEQTITEITDETRSNTKETTTALEVVKENEEKINAHTKIEKEEHKHQEDTGIEQVATDQDEDASKNIENINVDTAIDESLEQEENQKPETSTTSEVEQVATVEDEDIIDKIKVGAISETESLIHFHDKLTVLKKAVSELQNVNTDGNADRELHRIRVLNTIKGYILFETMEYLRVVKKKTDHFVSYAEKFPYPISVDIYNDRKKEIESLSQDFDDLPAETSVEDRKRVIKEQVAEGLRLLEEMAKYNEQLKENSTVIVSNTVVTNSTPNSTSKPISSIKNKAVSDLRKVSGLDRTLARNMPQIKIILDYISKNYQSLDDLEVEKLDDKTKELNHQQEIIDEMKLDSSNVGIINTVFDSASKLLEDAKLKAVSNPTSKKVVNYKKPTFKTQRIEDYKKKLEQAEVGVKDLKEKSKENFDELVNELFKLKEGIEDIPAEHTELDFLRKALLEEISNILSDLDKDVAQLVTNQKPSELQLQLTDNFREIKLNKDVVKDSVEFIDQVVKKAQHFENYVDNFFGTKDLVDYYVIEENLMRLLEELDQINCQGKDNLRKATVDAMDYIKKLIDRLERNAEKKY